MNSIWGIALFVSVIGLILSVLASITTIQLWMLGELSVSTVTTGLSVAHRDGALIRRVADYLEGPRPGWIVPKKKRKARRKTKGTSGSEKRKKNI
jgi:hypothetical protein